jgi:hypothetical protein
VPGRGMGRRARNRAKPGHRRRARGLSTECSRPFRGTTGEGYGTGARGRDPLAPATCTASARVAGHLSRTLLARRNVHARQSVGHRTGPSDPSCPADRPAGRLAGWVPVADLHRRAVATSRCPRSAGWGGAAARRACTPAPSDAAVPGCRGSRGGSTRPRRGVHEVDSAPPSPCVRASRLPATAINNFQPQRSPFDPEEQLDDGRTCRRPVCVIDDVRRGLVDGQHQVGLGLGHDCQRTKPPTNLATDRCQRTGLGRPDPMRERRGIDAVSRLIPHRRASRRPAPDAGDAATRAAAVPTAARCRGTGHRTGSAASNRTPVAQVCLPECRASGRR